MGEGVAPVPTSGGHQRYPSTNQDPKTKSGIEPDLSDDTHKATSLPSKDPYSTSALTVNAGIGTCVTADPTAWFVWSNSLSVCSRTCGGETQSISKCHAHRTVGDPGISSMSSSYIVKDELMGITYVDTVTTSVGRVTLSGPGLEALPTSLMIEDITDSQ